MSFGALQRSFTKRCVRYIIEGKEARAKSDLCEFISYIRSKKPLLDQFYVYENIRNHTEPDRDLAIMFVKETLELVDELSRGDVLTMNNLLRYKFNIQAEHDKLDEAISVLIESRVSEVKYNTSIVASAFKVVLGHVMSEKPTMQPLDELTRKHNQFSGELEFFTPQDVVRIGVHQFNKEFGPLFTEAERKLFDKLRHADDEQSLGRLYEEEYNAMLTEADKFTATKIDDDLRRNIELAKKKLHGQPSIDNLVNIFELKTQMQSLMEKQ